MAFGQNKSWGNKSSFNGGGSTKEWSPQVKIARVKHDDNTNTDKMIITITWVKAQDYSVLASNCNKIAPDVFTLTKKPGDTVSFDIIVNLDKIDEFKNNYIDTIVDVLRKTMHYTKSSLDSLGESIVDKVNEAPTPQEIAQSRETIAGNWMDMLNKMNDPEVRKKLLLYQTTVSYEREYGWKLSPNNVHEILAQNPLATFVTSERGWKREFNRTVNLGAKAILIDKAVPTSLSKSQLDAAARKRGFDSYDDASKKTNKSTQVLRAIQNQANMDFNGYKEYTKARVYDVSDTTPIDPSHDLWMEKVGLSNNLIGTLKIKQKKSSVIS